MLFFFFSDQYNFLISLDSEPHISFIYCLLFFPQVDSNLCRSLRIMAFNSIKDVKEDLFQDNGIAKTFEVTEFLFVKDKINAGFILETVQLYCILNCRQQIEFNMFSGFQAEIAC